MTNQETEWVNTQLKFFREADKTVLEFIAKIIFHSGSSGAEIIQHLFTAGYCYYFANMLKDAFGRGMVCYAYYEGHFVWLDGTSQTKDIAYDIRGVNCNWEYLIPVEKIGDGVWDFKHVPGKQSNMTDPEIAKLLLDIVKNKEYAK